MPSKTSGSPGTETDSGQRPNVRSARPREQDEPEARNQVRLLPRFIWERWPSEFTSGPPQD